MQFNTFSNEQMEFQTDKIDDETEMNPCQKIIFSKDDQISVPMNFNIAKKQNAVSSQRLSHIIPLSYENNFVNEDNQNESTIISEI